jgi:hypothetical protein
MSDRLTEKYVESVGRPPANLPDDHPDRWQWEYSGTKAERDALLETLGGEPEADEQITQEETLFGDVG